MGILVEVERLRLNYLWRKRNKKNHTRIGVPSNIERIKIGDYTYGMLNVRNEGLENWLIIGKFCSIATGVFFIVDAEHPQNFLTTFPIHSYILKDGRKDSISKGTIELKDDVWVASNAVILSGVTVGQGAVIAAGAVVNKNVPPYALAAGVPAKIIKYRFSKEIIDYLLTLDYEKLDGELIKSHVNDFQTDISGMTLDEIKNLYNWFPKKKE